MLLWILRLECVNESYEEFVAQDSVVASWLLSTISPHLLPQFVGAETAATIWRIVLQFFANRSTTALMNMHYKLHSLKKGGDNMCVYLTRVKEGSTDRGYFMLLIAKITGQESLRMDLVRAAMAGAWMNQITMPTLYGSTKEGSRNLRYNSGKTSSSCENCSKVCVDGPSSSIQPQANVVTIAADRWVVDSGATHHVTPDASNMINQSEFLGPGKLTVGNGVALGIDNIDKVALSTTSRVLLLNDLLHVPQITENLLSISKLAMDNSVFLEFHAKKCYVHDEATGHVLLSGEEVDGLYSFEKVCTGIKGDVNIASNSLSATKLWHRRLGHPSFDTLNKIAKNGKVERRHRHLVELALVLLSQASIPIKFWSYAMVTVKHKLNFQSQPYTYLGVSPQHKGYQCLALDGRICISRHVVFNEWAFPFKEKSSSPTDSDNNMYCPQDLEIVSNIKLLQNVQGDSNQNVSKSLRSTSSAYEENVNTHGEHDFHVGNNADLQVSSSGHIEQHSDNEVENVQEEDIVDPPDNTRSCGQAEVQESSEPAKTHQLQNVHPMLTRSKCGVFKPKAFSSHFDNAIPTSIKEAMQSSEWKNVVQDEINALQKNETWSLVKLPPGRTALGCKWLFKLKHNPDGSILRYKARLVAKGFTQVPGHNFCDTFSPVVKFTTLNVILTMAVSNAWELRHIDIKNAFLNGDLKEDAFMQQPLASSICLMMVLPCGSGRVYLLVYVDDILITGRSSHGIKIVVNMLQGKFSLKDLGALSYFLGIEVLRTNKSIVLSQRKFALELLEKTGMKTAAPCSTPMTLACKLSREEGDFLEDASEYRSIVGSLLYLCHTRPDLSLSVDADWGANLDDRRSVSGYGVFLGKCLVAWSLKKQRSVSRSTMEADYKSVADATAEVTWISTLLTDLGIQQQGKSVIWCDNTSVVAMSANPISCTIQAFAHQVADGFTKPLSKETFEEFREKVCVVQR
ncbi:hypothetical protein F3Y22_tig00110260pilonHSYRG00155 [Hibiscus syriacus]|uniref:Reverse transcriptase Ty1/copia-type domain-containing protein n=1 Tax=Hibiscus syriacus TaxID=106335 RepID=A0A6A3B952_HIBSY|nr:hypothetical protein F3Y22_tig00110260pilonHSYRG00155 [Hibiscus syriacus]